MRTDVTCGPIYSEARNKFTGDLPEHNKMFAAGHVTGQAEKVYLGACDAAMFRPTSDGGLKFLKGAIISICEVYGLSFSSLEYYDGEWKEELWIHREDKKHAIYELRNMGVNCPEWHWHRGLLCGIQPSEIDSKFHKRAGLYENIDGNMG